MNDALTYSPKRSRRTRPRPEAAIRGVRWLVLAVAVLFVAVFLVVPVLAVFREALRRGLDAYMAALNNDETWAALRLSLLVTAVVVPANLVFGVVAAWLVTKHDFLGKTLLITLIDLPFTVSPVVAGLVYVLLFGRNGWFGTLLAAAEIKVIFAVPGIVLATLFVTFPMVARELIPVMAAQGREEELAARVLGANGWQTLWRITLPNVKWGLIYGVVVCAARAMGEFGAVSVVSGHIRGLTNTLPLQVEIQYNEYDLVGAFTSASLLASFAVISLVVKTYVEWRGQLAAERGMSSGLRRG